MSNNNLVQNRPATMQDVANASGVSLSSVSKILSGATNFKAETIKKVENAAALLHYTPNAMARSIASNTSNRIIGYLVPNLFNSYYADMVTYLEKYLHQHNYELTVCLFHDDATRVAKYLKFLTQIRAAGVIFGSFHEPACQKDIDLAREYMSIVSIQGDVNNVDRVDVTDYDGTYEMISYLIKKGHRKIGFLGYQYEVQVLAARAKAYKDALADNGIPFNPDYFLDYTQKPDSGYTMANQLLDLPDPPTAIHCFNEYIVPGVYNAIYDRGLRIPEDISVTGFDGIHVSEELRPKLTTVYGPNDTMAQTAVNMLLSRIEGKSSPVPQHIMFKTSIIERQSVADLNK